MGPITLMMMFTVLVIVANIIKEEIQYWRER